MKNKNFHNKLWKNIIFLLNKKLKFLVPWKQQNIQTNFIIVLLFCSENPDLADITWH